MFNETIVKPETRLREKLQHPARIILWNDDHNTFEWVIESLMEICSHTHEQAEQCAWFVHFRGKYAVKEGTYKEMKPMCDALTDRGLGATIDL